MSESLYLVLVLRFMPGTTHHSKVWSLKQQTRYHFPVTRGSYQTFSAISPQRIGGFPVNVSPKNLHFTKTVLCKHALSHLPATY